MLIWLRTFVLSALLAAAVASIATPLITRVRPDAAASQQASFTEGRRIARVAKNVLIITFLGAYAWLGARRRHPLWRACGLRPVDRPAVWYLRGFVVGVVPLIALNLGLLACGARTVIFDASLGSAAWTMAKYFAAGFGLALMEEVLFRGLMIGDLTRVLPVRGGAILGTCIYALTHLLRSPQRWSPPQSPATLGLEAVGELFAGLGDAFREWPDLLGLFLVGMILTVLFLRLGHVWLAMGVHAGWYWVSQVDRIFVDSVREVVRPNRLFFGGEVYYDGVVGWLALSLTLVIILVWFRRPNAAT